MLCFSAAEGTVGCISESESSPGNGTIVGGREGKAEEVPQGQRKELGRAHWGWWEEGTTFNDDGAWVGGEESSKPTTGPDLSQSLFCF